MKICEVVPSLEVQHGGPTRSVYGLSMALAHQGQDVTLLATDPRETGQRNDGPLRIAVFARQSPQRLCPSAGLRDALAAGGADVIHHHALWLRTLHYAHRATRGRGVFVVSPRGMMSDWAWSHHRIRKQLARACVHPGALEAVDGWHATSTAEEAEIRARGFQQPVCVAPNGIDAPTAAEVQRAAGFWHAACPATRTRPVALFYSRFHAKKRVLELIDLWLEHAPVEWLLLLVGIPEDYTPDTLARRVGDRAGSERVAIFAGRERPPPYAVASLFVLPSHNENFGLVVAEALAHGVPPLVTDTTPWQALNREGCGWCVSWSQFASAACAAMAEGPAALRTRGLRGRDWVLREFSWAETARRLIAFYAALRK